LVKGKQRKLPLIFIGWGYSTNHHLPSSTIFKRNIK